VYFVASPNKYIRKVDNKGNRRLGMRNTDWGKADIKSLIGR